MTLMRQARALHGDRAIIPPPACEDNDEDYDDEDYDDEDGDEDYDEGAKEEGSFEGLVQNLRWLVRQIQTPSSEV